MIRARGYILMPLRGERIKRTQIVAPYRIDVACPLDHLLDRLVRLGALDVEQVAGGFAAIIPDGVTPNALADELGVSSVSVSDAVPRDNGSVWLLRPRVIRIGSVLISPLEGDAPPNALRLSDSSVFGTGHHPTTALCIEAIEEALSVAVTDSVLDVGTGSGVLAMAALVLGVPRATGLDVDPEALRIASENSRLNNLENRLQLVHGGPGEVNGVWPLVVANVLAGPLIDMAPTLVRRVGNRGRLILSGIPSAVEPDVRQTYARLGMRHVRSETRAGWTAVVIQASW